MTNRTVPVAGQRAILRRHICKDGVPKDIVCDGLLREEWDG